MPTVSVLRFGAGLVLLGGACLLAPAAEASSFVSVAPPQGKLSSSFLVLGEAPPPAVQEAAVQRPEKHRSSLDTPPDFAWEPAPAILSPSVIALGAPAVEDVKVAAIPKPVAAPKPAARRKPYIVPKVVRAGVQGHAFPDYVAPAAAQAPNTPTPQPAAAQPSEQKPQREQPDPTPAKQEPLPAIRGQELGEPS